MAAVALTFAPSDTVLVIAGACGVAAGAEAVVAGVVGASSEAYPFGRDCACAVAAGSSSASASVRPIHRACDDNIGFMMGPSREQCQRRIEAVGPAFGRSKS